MLSKLKSTLRSALVCTVSLLATASMAQTTINVGPGQAYATIQSGINAANTGDTVLVAPGTYTENIKFDGKAITVISAQGAAKTIIQGDGSTAVVTFYYGETRSSVLNGFTIQGVSNPSPQQYYPGVLVGSAPTILNNIITNNPCNGIDVDFGGPLIQGNTISNTNTSNNGACASFTGSGIVLGGGAYPTSVVIGNTIIHNQHAVDYDGGGILIWAALNPVIESNVIANNGTTGQGGAIAAYNSDAMIIAQNLFYGNTAAYGAGAISILAPDTSQGPFFGLIQNNTFVGNTVSYPNEQGSLSASQVYLEGNLAQYEFTDNIVVGADANPSFVCGPTYNYLSVTPLVIDHNDIYNTAGPAYGGACPDQTGQYGNISSDPLFKNATGDDYHLLAGSPAIDTGNNSALQLLANLKYPLAGDLDGNPRVQDATGKGYPVIDMGVYESPGATTASPTTMVLNPSFYQVGGGSSFSLTANLYSPLGTPTGTVSFFEDGTPIGTSSIDGAGAAELTQAGGLSPGTHAFLATYPGKDSFTPCESVKIYVIVNAYGVTLTLSSSANPSQVGQNVTFQSKIAAANGVPPGSITLTDSTTNTTLATLTPDANGNATYSISTLAAGTHLIEASYPGNATYLSADASVSQVVESGSATTTRLSSSLNPSTFGTLVNFTATVSLTGGGSPTGTVTFMDGNTFLATVNLQNGSAVYITPGLSIGSHTITANYQPTGSFSASTASLTQVIVGYATSTALACRPNPVIVTYLADFDATVTSANGTPTGSVAFTEDGSLVGTFSLISGATFFTNSFSTVGPHNIVATYTPTGSFAASSASCSEVVSAFPTTSFLNVAPATSTYGSPVTLTATVSPAMVPTPGTPTSGVVTFYDGASSVGTATLVGGVATLVPDNLPGGSYKLTCTYGGSSIYATSNCNSVPVTVNAAPTVLTVSSSNNPAPALSTFTLTTRLTVNGQSAGAGEIIHLTINGQSVNLTTDATGSATYAIGSLGPNSYTVIASFAGNSNFLASSATMTEVVTALASSTSLTASPNPGDLNQSVTMVATVSSPSATSQAIGGTVIFYDGATSIGSAQVTASGTATLAATFTAVGVHNLKAVYGGDADVSGSTSAVFEETIVAGDFSISAQPGAASLYTGEAAVFQVNATSLRGFNQPLALTCTGLPANATCAFSPASLPGGQGAASLVIQTAAPHESSSSSASGSGSGIVLGALTLLLVPGWRRRRRFLTGLSLVLLAIGVGMGMAGCGAPSPIAGGTPPGTYQVAVTATAGTGGSALTRSSVVTVTVRSLF